MVEVDPQAQLRPDNVMVIYHAIAVAAVFRFYRIQPAPESRWVRWIWVAP